jgi:hypothetical protein
MKNVENKVKPLARNTKHQKRKILLLGSSNGREIGPMLNEHLALYMKSQVFLSPMHHLLMLRTWGRMVMTLPSEIILLLWKGQETAWIEITSTRLKRTSTSLQRAQII